MIDSDRLLPRPPADQVARVEALRTALQRAESPGGPGVQLLETHISWVLVTSHHAYKLKKAVNLGFVDQRDRAWRRRACEEEVRLNRRTAANLYLGVVGVAADGRLLPAEDPAALDHAVRMRRFSPDDTLERRLGAVADEVAAAWVDELADAVIALHQQAAAVRGSDQGLLADLRRATHEQPSDWLACCRSPAEREQVSRVLAWLAQCEARHDSLCRARRDAGFVRELHGDLHLGNVCLFEGRVTVFDCIDFSPALRTLDVMNDLAFLLMDLRVRGHGRLAWRVLSRYLDATGDHEGVALLPGFMVWRALVRFKVARLSAGARADEAALTLLQGLDTLMRVGPPVLIGMHGVSGCGKSAVSQGLLAVLGAVRLRSDVERSRVMAAADIDLGQRHAEAGHDAVYAHLLERAEALLSIGQRVILDATFLAPRHRRLVQALAERLGCPWAWVHCEAPLETIQARLAARRGDASEADAQVLAHQLQGLANGAGALDAAELARTVCCDTRLPVTHWAEPAAWSALWRLLGPAVPEEGLLEG